jgi:hypothetical protein
VPILRCQCDCGCLSASVPWSHPGSRFILLQDSLMSPLAN